MRRLLLHTLSMAVFLLMLGSSPPVEAQVPSRPPTHVVDLAGILPSEDAKALRDRLVALETKGAAQMVILVVPELEKGQTPFWQSLKIARQWKLGIGEKSNGVLVFHAVKERETLIQVGKHLEEKLTDSVLTLDVFEKHMRPHLLKNEYAKGFNAGVDRMTAFISGEAEAPERTLQRQNLERELLGFLLFVGAFVLLCFANWFHQYLGGAVGGSTFAGASWLLAFTNPVIIVLGIVGLLLGLFIHHFRHSDIPVCPVGCGAVGDVGGVVIQGAGVFLGAAGGGSS